MTRISFLTESGKTVCIDPSRQKTLFWNFQDGLIAEARLKERTIPYDHYRRRLKSAGGSKSRITISRSAKKELDALDDTIFAKLDAGILSLAEAPTEPGSTPKAFRVLLGNLRLTIVAEWPIVYTSEFNKAGTLRILRIGFSKQFTAVGQ